MSGKPQRDVPLRTGTVRLSEQQLDAHYRQKAAELRVAAKRTSNFIVSVELEKAADNYDKLAELVEKQSEAPHGN
jgi:hypothetical protein